MGRPTNRELQGSTRTIYSDPGGLATRNVVIEERNIWGFAVFQAQRVGGVAVFASERRYEEWISPQIIQRTAIWSAGSMCSSWRHNRVESIGNELSRSEDVAPGGLWGVGVCGSGIAFCQESVLTGTRCAGGLR